MNGLLQHLVLSLRLNFRSRQAIVYGYLVPVFFLLAFGSVFRSTVPPLVREMGQLLTITILGGACFGMPTTMVSEREHGVWRRYRLLPASTAGLILSAMVGRYLIVALAAAMQIVLAWCIYRTPFPVHPMQLAVAYTFVCFAFLGLGLIIAMLADTVPAVQALGQAIFLPMIMIGGVGVPLRVLPRWAQNVAGFLPGRYAVEVLQACIADTKNGLGDARFALVALAVIGIAACIAGAKLYRWDAGQKIPAQSRGWLLVALAGWVGIGLAASFANRPPTPLMPGASGSKISPSEAWRGITEADLNSITYEDLPDDSSTIVPLAPNLTNLSGDDRKRIDLFQTRLSGWGPGNDRNIGQRVKYCLCVCAIADLAEDQNEAEIPYVVFERLKQTIPLESLEKALGWIVFHPGEGRVVSTVPELGLETKAVEPRVRERCALYAKKFLRVLLRKEPKEI
jgi:ABC-2 type transport system permease protein